MFLLKRIKYISGLIIFISVGILNICNEAHANQLILIVSDTKFKEKGEWVETKSVTALAGILKYEKIHLITGEQAGDPQYIYDFTSQLSKQQTSFDVFLFSHGVLETPLLRGHSARFNKTDDYYSFLNHSQIGYKTMAYALSPLAGKIRVFYTSACRLSSQYLKNMTNDGVAKIAVGHTGMNTYIIFPIYFLIRIQNQPDVTITESIKQAYMDSLFVFSKFPLLELTLNIWAKFFIFEPVELKKSMPEESSPLFYGGTHLTPQQLL